jgi:HSP20 family molecular chaperone IbpA
MDVSAKFWRSLSLPETVKHDGIEAAYKDGVLEDPRAEGRRVKAAFRSN